jgi:hypothetical protein
MCDRDEMPVIADETHFELTSCVSKLKKILQECWASSWTAVIGPTFFLLPMAKLLQKPLSTEYIGVLAAVDLYSGCIQFES